MKRETVYQSNRIKTFYTGKRPDENSPLTPAIKQTIQDTLSIYGHLIGKDPLTALELANEIKFIYATLLGSNPDLNAARNRVFYLFNLMLDLYNHDKIHADILYNATPAALRTPNDIFNFEERHADIITRHLLYTNHPPKWTTLKSSFWYQLKEIATIQPGADPETEQEEIFKMLEHLQQTENIDPEKVTVIHLQEAQYTPEALDAWNAANVTPIDRQQTVTRFKRNQPQERN